MTALTILLAVALALAVWIIRKQGRRIMRLTNAVCELVVEKHALETELRIHGEEVHRLDIEVERQLGSAS